MDYEYYGLSHDDYSSIINRRSDFVLDYWKKGRHFSKHRNRNPGLASRVADKNVYDNLLRSFYNSSTQLSRPQGVFYGYGYNNFTDIHLNNKYLLKADLKSCYRMIKFQHFQTIISDHESRLIFPLPLDMVKVLYFPNGYLQAGLTSSNIISDIVIKYLFDKSINKTIHEHGATDVEFSRYYDDFYISANDKSILINVRDVMKMIAKKEKLPLNYNKCYLGALSGTQVLKSTIIDGEVRVSRKHKNNLRAAVYQFENISSEEDSYEGELRSVLSRLRHICTVEKAPHQKYKDAYDDYRDLLKDYTEQY